MGLAGRAGEWFKAHWPRKRARKDYSLDEVIPLVDDPDEIAEPGWQDLGSLGQGGFVKVAALATTELQEEFFNRHNPPPRFRIGQVVTVRSSHYGSWDARIEDRRRLQNGTWRYEVSDQGLRVSYPHSPPPRRSDVPEELLEHRRSKTQVWFSADFGSDSPSMGLWAISTPVTLGSIASRLNPLQQAAQAAEMMRGAEIDFIHFDEVELTKDQWFGQDHFDESQLEPLHRDFLLAIDHVGRVIGDVVFAERMREDLVGLWHEEKVAKGLQIWEALGMSETQYNRWVERDFKRRQVNGG